MEVDFTGLSVDGCGVYMKKGRWFVVLWGDRFIFYFVQ